MSPRIQEYLPEQEAAQPQGGISPNLETIGQLGQGLQNFGRQVTETSDVIESRSAMMEAADAQSQISETKADFYNRVKDETNRGVLDQNKLLDDYDEWTDKTGSQFNTPRGRAEFERASGRTRGSLIRWAAQGSAQIAGANALADHTTTVNNLTNLTQQDPHSFADNMGQLEELYNGYENDPNMNKNPIALQKMKQGEQSQLASAAIQGQMNGDFNTVVQDMVASNGKVDPTEFKYNTANGMLNSGVYDNYLDANKKSELSKAIRANFSAAQTEGQRVLSVQSTNQEKKAQDWQSSVTGKMVNGQLTTQEILAGAKANNMTMESTLSMIRSNAAMAKLAADKKDTTPPDLYNSINDRILNGEIDSPEKLMKYGPQGLTGTDYEKFHSLLDKTPAGKANLEQEKQLTEWAKSRTVGESEKFGDKAPGEYQLMLWSQGLQAAKKQAVEQGKPVSSVLNPTSPDFFGKNTQYFLSPSELLKQQAEQARSSAGIKQEQPNASTPEETIMMYKNGVGRPVYKSKQKEAEQRGYATGASNNDVQKTEVTGPSPASSAVPVLDQTPQEEHQFPINEALKRTPPKQNDSGKAESDAFLEQQNAEKEATIAKEMAAKKRKKQYQRSHLEE